jgi:predicted nucleic acid-binding protein
VNVFVDSDILIEIARVRNLERVSQWLALARSRTPILYSPVSEAEVWSGALSHEFEKTEQIFEIMKYIPIDVETGRRAGGYLRSYAKSHGVRLGDALIAAGAWRTGAALWTRNRKHYPMQEIAFY